MIGAMWLLWVLYLAGAGLEVAGLLTAGSVLMHDNDNGTVTFETPGKREIRRSVGLILAGVMVGLAGNLASMYIGK